MGGVASLAHLRDVLVRLGMLVISEQIALGNAAKAFDHMDHLVNERSAAMLNNACASLVEKARLLG
jgi:NAD(P)H-dependent FMN reductase